MITFHLLGRDVKENQRRARLLVAHLPKKAYYHFLFEPSLIIRIHNKDRKYLAQYCEKRKWRYKTYRYPFTRMGYGEQRQSATYIYRDEFIPLMNLESRLALKSKKKHHLSIIERYYHTFLNTLGYDWENEAKITNWLFMGRINTYRHYYGDGAIVSLICTIIILNCRINRFLIKGLT